MASHTPDTIKVLEERLQAITKKNQKERKDTIDYRADRDLQNGAVGSMDYIFNIDTGNIYKYAGDGKMLKRDSKGEFTIDITPGSSMAKEYFNGKALCNSVLMEAGVECNDTITACILNDDPKSLFLCAKKLKETKKDVNKFLYEEFKAIHPSTAIEILKKFGLRQHTVNGVKHVETVAHWLGDYVSEKFTLEEQKEIAKNEILLAYLNALVNFVNGNVNILNPELKSSIKKPIDVKLPRAGNRLPHESVYYTLERLKGHLQREKITVNFAPLAKKILNVLGGIDQNTLPSVFATNFPGIYQPKISKLTQSTLGENLTNYFSQFGENLEWMTKYVPIPTFSSSLKKDLAISQIEGKAYPTWVILDHLKKKLLSELTKEGKELHPDTLKSINKNLNKLKDAEIELMGINKGGIVKKGHLETLYKYILLYKKYGHLENTEKLINRQKVEEFVNIVTEFEKNFLNGQLTYIELLSKVASYLGHDLPSNEGHIPISVPVLDHSGVKKDPEGLGIPVSRSSTQPTMRGGKHTITNSESPIPLGTEDVAERVERLSAISISKPTEFSQKGKSFNSGSRLISLDGGNLYAHFDNLKLSQMFLDLDKGYFKESEKQKIHSEFKQRIQEFNDYYSKNNKYDIWF